MKGKIILVEWGWTKKWLTMNLKEKYIVKLNTTSENIIYLVDNKNFLCQHNKLHPLTARRGNQISETMYKDIEEIIQHDSHKYITSEGGDDLINQKQTNYEIEYNMFCYSNFTKSLCLEIKKIVMFLGNYIYFSKHLIWMMITRKIVMVFQLI